MLFSCFFVGFLLFSPKGSATGYDSSLGSFCYSPVYFLSRMHLHSGYYYYDYAVIGVLRPRGLQKFSFELAYCCIQMLIKLIKIIIQIKYKRTLTFFQFFKIKFGEFIYDWFSKKIRFYLISFFGG